MTSWSDVRKPTLGWPTSKEVTHEPQVRRCLCEWDGMCAVRGTLHLPGSREQGRRTDIDRFLLQWVAGGVVWLGIVVVVVVVVVEVVVALFCGRNGY